MIENENEISPVLLAFLDTDDFDEKYKLLIATPEGDFDDLMIDNMASSIDVVIPDGSIDARLQDLKNCVRTRAKYETLRLRK